MKRSFVLTVLALAAACSSAPPPAATPQTQPAPARSSNALVPAANVARSIAAPRIRVGMASDQTTVTFPRVDGGYYLIADSGASTLHRGFTDTAPLSDKSVRYAVQASALSDKPSADAFVEKIRTETGQRVDAIFDPAAGLYRILAGDFPDTRSAQPLRDQLVGRGYGKEMLVVRRPTDQPFDHVHQIVDDEGERTTINGDSILVIPISADTITIDRKPYRGGARLFLNSRGLLNVINELNLEEYLRGVVPAEMGSKVFDELEALKAQTVAARTYAVRNLGQFHVEGYDICPGPACQAYNGFSGEEAMTDQAVKETAGLVMWYDGKPIDALFTSTCGGETSDVGTMFPGRTDPYLKRVRCVELDLTTLAGRADSGILTETQVSARIFEAVAALAPATAWSGREVEAAVNAALRLMGKADSAERAASSRRGDVLEYLARVAAFDTNGMVLTLPEDRKYFFPQSGSPETRAYAAAAFLIKYGFLPAQNIDRVDLSAAMPREELYGILGSWLRKHDALKEATGKIVTIAGRTLAIKTEGKSASFTLPDGIPIFRRIGDRYQEYKAAPVMPGDRVFIQQNVRKTPVSMIVQANYDGASFDRTSSFANWTRSYRADELVTSINRRNAIQQLQGLRPTVVDASNRIAEMEVTAENGRTFVLKGLPIRWSLNVPDNLFVFDKSVDPDGVDRYTFYGKGWGHGIGLCQVGAYGMAFRGYKFDQILKHYYTGIEITNIGGA